MLIGILSDIHGNADALRSVLAEAKKSKVDQLLVLGDCVGYYYAATEVFKLLDGWKEKKMIRGNHENFLLGILNGTIKPADIKAKYGSAIEVAIQTLTKDDLRAIEQMPFTDVLLADSLRIQLCHGSPWDTDQYIYPDSDNTLLDRCDGEFDYVLLGHTHYPFMRRGRKSTVINPGSVGQSRVHGGIADWATLDTQRNVVVFRQTPYDTSNLLAMVEKNDPQVPYLKSILTRR